MAIHRVFAITISLIIVFLLTLAFEPFGCEQSYALSPLSKTKDERFRNIFLEAAKAVRSGDVKRAATLAGTREDRLRVLGDAIKDFSVETHDMPPFPTEPPAKNPSNPDARVDEFLRRELRYPLLSSEERSTLQKHLLEKFHAADNFLRNHLAYIMQSWGLSTSNVKGIFIRGGWLWYGLSTEPKFRFARVPRDLDLFIIVSDNAFNHAEYLPLDTGLGPQLVHIHWIVEKDFLAGPSRMEFSVNLLKLLAYRGIQMRGPLYFAGQQPSQEHLIILANVVLGHFINMLVDGEVSKALSRLREAEIILSYVGWHNARRPISLQTTWNFLEKDMLMPEELEGMRDAILHELFDAKEMIQIGKLADLISAERNIASYL